MDITITLNFGEIIFDVQNKTYLSGRTREAADAKAFAEASQMQASDAPEDAYQVHRSLANALAVLEAEVSDWLASSDCSGDNAIAAEIEEEGKLELVLSLPPNFNAGATAAIGNAMHQFLTNRAIADWFGITSKADAEAYAAKAETSLDQLHRSLSRRHGPQRPRPLQPM